MKKRPKYRPPSKIDWKECRQVTKDALSSFCKKWCKREKSDKKSLDSYLNKCMNVVDKRISHFENNLEVNNRVHKTPIFRIRNKLQYFQSGLCLYRPTKQPTMWWWYVLCGKEGESAD